MAAPVPTAGALAPHTHTHTRTYTHTQVAEHRGTLVASHPRHTATLAHRTESARSRRHSHVCGAHIDANGCKSVCRKSIPGKDSQKRGAQNRTAHSRDTLRGPQRLTLGGSRASWLWGVADLSQRSAQSTEFSTRSWAPRALVPGREDAELAPPSTPAPGDAPGDASGCGADVSKPNGASAALEPGNGVPSGVTASASGPPVNGFVTVSSDGAPRVNGGVTVKDASGDAPARQGWQWQRRWTVVALCFVAFLLCNMDRVNMSIAILPMAEEFKWSPATVGLVQSSFFWGYLLTQVAGGVWADTYGGKQVLGFGVVWWSLATVLTPLAARMGLPMLLFARACMGIGEGVAMPAMNNLLSKWVPVGERSRSLALVYSGMYLGSVLGLSLSPGLIHSLGWPSVFYSFGSLGVFWFLFWQRKAKSSPSEDPSLSRGERELLLGTPTSGAPGVTAQQGEGVQEGVQEGAQPSSGGGGGHFAEGPLRLSGIPWRKLLSKGPVWAIIVSHFCHNWGVFILLTWMPTYYHDVLGFDLTKSGLFAVLPWLTMAVASNVAGWIADSLICKGWDVTTVRKMMQTIGFLGPAICLSLLSKVTSPVQAILLLMASQGSDAFSQSGLYSNHQDIGPQYAGILLGLSNTAGVLAGVIGTYVTGRILQYGSWDQVFEVAVALYLVGTLVWNLFSTGKRVFE